MPRPSPLPNRCRPDGSLVATTARGEMMGNRGGRLHRVDFTLGRARWRSKAWICCETSFRGRRRRVMETGYTEIFFLDEATALAAGHRPLLRVPPRRRPPFRGPLHAAHGAKALRAGEIDHILHAARCAQAPECAANAVPPGAICRQSERFYRLRVGAGWLEWTDTGYAIGLGPKPGRPTHLCTPDPICAVLRAGYAPRLHPSAASPQSASWR